MSRSSCFEGLGLGKHVFKQLGAKADLEGQEDLQSRLIRGMVGDSMWLTSDINLLTRA